MIIPLCSSHIDCIVRQLVYSFSRPTPTPCFFYFHYNFGVFSTQRVIAGLGNNPVQVFRTGCANHWEFLRLWTGFELPSSCLALPACASNRNRNILDFMRWPQIDLVAQDLNDIQRPKSFQKNSWK
jgi:hypothetical protein